MPRSCNGARSAGIGMRAERCSPSPNRSAKSPNAWSPTWADDLVAPRFHNDGKRAGSFHFVGALLLLVLEDFAILRIPGGKGTYADTRLSGQAAA